VTRALRAALAGLLAGGALAAPAQAAPRELHLGFVDDAVLFDRDPAVRSTWLGNMRAVGADRVRVSANWRSIARRAPAAGDDPADPAWSGYAWAAFDTAVADARAAGLEPIVLVSSAPAWAEGAGRPQSAPAGSWRPDPAALAAFARAVSLRHPEVRFWQAWNEPNLDVYLSPQFAAGRPAAPAHYRRMLNAFHAAIKAVDPRDVVITAGTAPFGDAGNSGRRTPPARFVRELLCLRGRDLAPAACPQPARFDVLAHHPYSVGSPRRKALNADDVSIPDLHKLVRPLRRAEAHGRALGARRHGVWVTEVSWDSAPADPQGVPAATHARWLEEALYLFWRAGVDTVTWWLARDQAPTPSFDTTYQSGVFARDGTPKPAARAFAFPLVADRLSGRRVRIWGRAPGAGPVVVQRRTRGSWSSVAALPASAGQVFTRTLGLARGTRIRARQGAATSLTWTVR